MVVNPTVDIDAVKAVVVEALGLEDRADALDATTAHVRCLPEPDSMAVLGVLLELERRLRIASLRIAIEGQDVTADVLETIASLAAVADEKLR